MLNIFDERGIIDIIGKYKTQLDYDEVLKELKEKLKEREETISYVYVKDIFQEFIETSENYDKVFRVFIIKDVKESKFDRIFYSKHDIFNKFYYKDTKNKIIDITTFHCNNQRNNSITKSRYQYYNNLKQQREILIEKEKDRSDKFNLGIIGIIIGIIITKLID